MEEILEHLVNFGSMVLVLGCRRPYIAGVRSTILQLNRA